MSALAGLPIAWLVVRGAGLVAFALLTLSVWLGLAMSTRLLGPRRQKKLLGLHRSLSWMGLSALGAAHAVPCCWIRRSTSGSRRC